MTSSVGSVHSAKIIQLFLVHSHCTSVVEWILPFHVLREAKLQNRHTTNLPFHTVSTPGKTLTSLPRSLSRHQWHFSTHTKSKSITQFSNLFRKLFLGTKIRKKHQMLPRISFHGAFKCCLRCHLVWSSRNLDATLSCTLDRRIHLEDFNSSKVSTISTSLIHNMASDGKSEQVVTRFLNRIFHTKTIVDQGICRIAIPIFAVSAVRPCSSAAIPPVLLNSLSTALLQMSALELCLDLVCLHLCE